MRVLLAEDEVVQRRLMEANLTRWGYEVVVARDGAEAWGLLQHDEAPQLAVLDWQMPEMDGVEVCRRVRARGQTPYVYILLLTSRDRKADVIAGLDAGADDYVTKPFDHHELRVRLRAGSRIVELEGALRSAMDTLAAAHVREMQVAAHIQQELLIGKPPQDFAGARIAALTIPSQHVDGDFYDFYVHGDRCMDVVIGDVMGKGVPAALVAAGIKSSLARALTTLLAASRGCALPEPERIISLLHSAAVAHVMRVESFATLCYARVDVLQGSVTYVDCGHTKTIHVRSATGEAVALEGDDMPLGLGATGGDRGRRAKRRHRLQPVRDLRGRRYLRGG